MGICVAVFEQPHGGLTVIMPDARKRRRSRNDHNETIPAHHSFLLVERKRLAPGPRFRSPDLYLGPRKQFAVCLLDREQISIGGAKADNLGIKRADTPRGAEDDPAWVTTADSVCTHLEIGREHVRFPPDKKVLSHVSLRSGVFRTAQRSAKEYEFDPRCLHVLPTGPRRLADLAVVEMEHVRRAEHVFFDFLSEPFDAPLPCDPLRVNAKAGETIQAIVGNVPLADLADFLKGEPGHIHRADHHFEIFYDLAASPPAPPYPIPLNRESVPRVGGCPPLVGTIES